MFQFKQRRSVGFSLLELVLVIVIIGIIGGIAIPRLSRGAAGAADSALIGNLSVLRNAIDLYATEHDGTFPTTSAIIAQLTTYSDINSNTQATSDSIYIYGPYIRKIPKLPIGSKKNSSGIAATNASGIGWIYKQATGDIRANTTTEQDVFGVLYSTY